MLRLKLILIVLIALLAISCDSGLSDEESFIQAKQINTTSAFRGYLDAFPKGQFRQDADRLLKKAKLDEINESIAGVDGANVISNSGALTPLKLIADEVGYTKVIEPGMDVSDLMASPWIRYVTKKQSTQITASEMEGIAIKGPYRIVNAVLHHLDKRKIKRLFENHGSAKPGSTVYTPGKKVPTTSSTLSNNSVLLTPKQALEPGDYVVWIYDGDNKRYNNIFWMFTVK